MNIVVFKLRRMLQRRMFTTIWESEKTKIKNTISPFVVFLTQTLWLTSNLFIILTNFFSLFFCCKIQLLVFLKIVFFSKVSVKWKFTFAFSFASRQPTSSHNSPGQVVVRWVTDKAFSVIEKKFQSCYYNSEKWVIGL